MSGLLAVYDRKLKNLLICDLTDKLIKKGAQFFQFIACSIAQFFVAVEKLIQLAGSFIKVFNRF
ncbi:hypothetical protein ACTMBE_01210 [Klebsiella pneumoniae]|uniref:hypothetical protein n=1 Tax=Klebsiella pneumoniae TaxID=573 RepID=UPI003F8D1353